MNTTLEDYLAKVGVVTLINFTRIQWDLTAR